MMKWINSRQDLALVTFSIWVLPELMALEPEPDHVVLQVASKSVQLSRTASRNC